MILRIIIDNLYSFNHQVEFNMFTNKSQRHSMHKRYIGKIAYLKMAALYGANGAGKSNMIKALGLLQNLVLNGSIPSVVDSLKFKLDKTCADRCSSLAVEFVAAEHTYFYTISFEGSGVLYEGLSETLSIDEDRTIFEREFDNGKENLHFYDGYSKEPKAQLFVDMLAEKFLGRKDVLLTMLQDKYDKEFPETKIAFNWFRQTLNVVNADEILFPIAHVFGEDAKLLKFGNTLMATFSTGVKGILPMKKEIERNEKNAEIFETLKHHDGAILDRMTPYFGERVSYTMEDGKVIEETLNTTHADSEGNEVPFSLGMESDGTKRLLDYIPMLHSILKDSEVVVIDEIERSIHPSVIKELIRLISKDDKMNGQLIFSTHETCLLDQDILRTDEIWFAQKNLSGATQLYSLSDFNVHSTANVENGYLNGRYGGIPFMNDLKTLHWDEE